MKKLKFILLILISILCLNSCFTIATMMGEGLLPYPEPESPYYYGNNKKLNTLLLTENKKKIEIGNSNVQISIPSGLKLKESNGLINNYLYEKKSFELHGYYLEKEIFLPIFNILILIDDKLYTFISLMFFFSTRYSFFTTIY